MQPLLPDGQTKFSQALNRCSVGMMDTFNDARVKFGLGSRSRTSDGFQFIWVRTPPQKNNCPPRPLARTQNLSRCWRVNSGPSKTLSATCLTAAKSPPFTERPQTRRGRGAGGHTAPLDVVALSASQTPVGMKRPLAGSPPLAALFRQRSLSASPRRRLGSVFCLRWPPAADSHKVLRRQPVTVPAPIPQGIAGEP